MGRDYSCAHAAVLAKMLPSDSRLARAENPALEWGTSEYILSHIEHDLRVLAWQQTEDARHKRNYPQHMRTPVDLARDRQVAESATPEAMEMVADRLGIPEGRR